MLVHSDIVASHSLWCYSPVPPHPKGVILAWLWTPFKYTDLIVMFKKFVQGDFSFVTWNIIPIEVAFTRWIHCGHKGIDMVSNNTQVHRVRLVLRAQHTLFPIFQCPVGVSSCVASAFLFVADRGGTRCGLLLLQLICIKVRCVGQSEMPFLHSLISELLLPFYQLEPVWSFSSDLWYQQSIFAQRTVAHCRFCFSDHSL